MKPILLLTLLALGSCTTPPAGPAVSDAEPGTVAYDRDVFQTLLGNHELSRREFP